MAAKRKGAEALGLLGANKRIKEAVSDEDHEESGEERAQGEEEEEVGEAEGGDGEGEAGENSEAKGSDEDSDDSSDDGPEFDGAFEDQVLALSPGVLKVTRIAPNTFDTRGVTFPHPGNSYNPHFASGTAATRFWHACWDELVDNTVLGNEAYEAGDPAEWQDIRDLIAHPVLRVSKPILRFAKAQRERVNVYNERMWDPINVGFDTPPAAAALMFNVNFSFDVDITTGINQDYGFAWNLEAQLSAHFPVLRSALFAINFANDLQNRMGAYKKPSSARYVEVRGFLRHVVRNLRQDFRSLRHKYIAVQDGRISGVEDKEKDMRGNNNFTVAHHILRQRGWYVGF